MPEHKGCLSELEMGAYLEGRLFSGKRAELERTLADCPDCLEEVVLAGRIITGHSEGDAADLPQEALQRAVALAARKQTLFDAVISLVKDTITVISSSPQTEWSYPTPVFGLRHTRAVSPQMVILRRTFDGINAELDIEQISAGICNLKVSVAPVHDDLPPQGIRIDLFNFERELASDFLVDGNVMFEDLGCGNYSVVIRKKETILGEITLKIE